jgi:nitrite reductase/ring-hydroxylating ferredoxin subunit
MLAFEPMFDRILGLFGGKPVVVRGTGKLQEGHARKIEIGDVLAGTGRQIVLCRVDGELFALDAVCPHEGGRIIEGPLVEGKYALCPLHNYKFDPKSGKTIGVVCRDAKRYKAKEKNGNCELWL